MRERNQQINFRVTKSEKAAIHRKAKLCGLTDSEYIRNCALDKPVAEMPREGLQIACRKLSSLVQYLEQFDDESSKKEAAWDFLKYIISEQGQNDFSEAGSGIPCLKKLANDENAVFKQYLVSETNHPNHQAFVAYPERDIPMNIYKGFEVNKQITIDKYIKDRTLSAFYKAGNRDQYYLDYKKDMEKIWAK